MLCVFLECRRESTSTEDLFYAHISGMDALARGLRNVATLKVQQYLLDTSPSFCNV